MQIRSVPNSWPDRVKRRAPCPRSRRGESRAVLLSARVQRLALLLLAILAGCAVRAPRPDAIAPQTHLPERTVTRLISVWQRQLAEYIGREGDGDPAVLSRTRVLHSRDVPRPARITFDVLDVDAKVPSRDGWDVEGVLIGKQSIGTHNWYLFLVGMVARRGYRPSSIDDIRLVSFSAQGGRLSWVIGPPEDEAVRRYSEAFHASPAVRFPGETDQFVMKVDEDRTWVHEVRSGAEWSLRRGGDTYIASGS